MTTRTALYRHRNAAGDLLYVGISLSPITRTEQHMKAAAWSADVASISIEWFGTRAEAEAAEIMAITGEAPLHNKMYAATDTGDLITDLISQWPARKDLAADIGADLAAVHKWAQSNRIPSGWMQSVIEAAQRRGFSWVTAAWMVAAHAQEARQ